MDISKGLFKTVIRSKPFSSGDLEAAHNAANTFIETVLDTDVDKTYSVKVAAAYQTNAGDHVVVIEYGYLMQEPPAEDL